MALEVTYNSICDVIRWLGEGHHVIIQYSPELSRCYHKCLDGAQAADQTVKPIDGARVVNVSILCYSPGIFDDYITNAGYSECSCSLEGRVTAQNNTLNIVVKGRNAAL